jgi:hypothetical protein
MHLDFRRNLGRADRWARLVAGTFLALSPLLFVMTRTWAVVTVVFGLFFLAEGIAGY